MIVVAQIARLRTELRRVHNGHHLAWLKLDSHVLPPHDHWLPKADQSYSRLCEHIKAHASMRLIAIGEHETQIRGPVRRETKSFRSANRIR